MNHLLRWCLAAALLAPQVAGAQGLTPRPGPSRTQQEDKPEGPAEAAPEGEGDDLDLPPLPSWPGQEKKKLQFFEMQGYLRFRADMYHNLSLGQTDFADLRAPFYAPISENGRSNVACSQRVGKPVPGGGDRDLEADDCPGNTLGGATLRLRLEPTINVAEQVRVKAQFDVFDNLQMGSTPRGLYGGPDALSAGGRSPDVPLVALSDTQAPPVTGRNSSMPAIVAKRAWAEVNTPLGQLSFGRMASHWGLGLLANDGSCSDCDFGDSADRVFFATNLANHTIGMGYEFASSGPSTLSVANGLPYYHGNSVDLEQLDDVDQLVWILGRIDKPAVLRDKVEQGELVLNYGLYLMWRKQDFDYGASQGLGSTAEDYAAAMVERHAWAWIPDLWFKLIYKQLYIEMEGVLIGGKIENISDEDRADPLSILQFGWVVRSQYKFLRDALKVGLEVGMASGDQAEPANGDYNRRRLFTLQDPSTNDTSLHEFRFDYDYHVDLILFRELLGTVSNAIYFKPSIQYDLLNSLGARLDIIYSLAHRAVAFPGNSPHLGLEFDLDLYYHNDDEGFSAGLQYGLLIPFGALDRPADIFCAGATAGCSRAQDAEVAQTLQARLMVKF